MHIVWHTYHSHLPSCHSMAYDKRKLGLQSKLSGINDKILCQNKFLKICSYVLFILLALHSRSFCSEALLCMNKAHDHYYLDGTNEYKLVTLVNSSSRSIASIFSSAVQVCKQSIHH